MTHARWNRIRKLGIGFTLAATTALLASPAPVFATVTIDDDLSPFVLGSWSVDVDTGGSTRRAYLTARRFSSGAIVSTDIIYDYFTYVDVGAIGGGFQLIGSAPVVSDSDPDEASSFGTFTGEHGNIIEWTATSFIVDSIPTMTTVYAFRSRDGSPLGRIRLYQYLDEDVEGAGGDVFFTRGTTVNDTFELFTSDDLEAYGVSQSGAFRYGAGLLNSQFTGWAVSRFDLMRGRITGAGQSIAPTGIIDSVGVATHPQFGDVRGPADIVSVMAWDVNESMNNATIATSLGGTPDDKTPIEPPSIEKPGDGEAVAVGGIDRSRPTVVLTHGLENSDKAVSQLWTGTGPRQAASLISSLTNADVNIVQFVWSDGFQPFSSGFPTAAGYRTARDSVTTAGTKLADQLVSLLGSNYSQSIHFIGHSLGSIVNAYAARQFLDAVPSVTSAQFTALDRPHHVSDLTGIFPQEEDALGYDEDFFAGVLPVCRAGLNLLVDNYYALDGHAGRGLGDRATGSIYNHPNLVDPKNLDNPVFLNEGVDSNGDGVQQWYRWTMRTRVPVPSGASVCNGATFKNAPPGVDASLNPCQRGFAWSLNADLEFPSRPACDGSDPEPVKIDVTGLRDFGCSVEGVGDAVRIVCNRETTTSSVSYRAADAGDAPVVVFGAGAVSIPDGAQYMQFDYEFEGSADSYATVLLNNFPIWKGAFRDRGGATTTFPLPIDGFRGRPILTVALFGPKLTKGAFAVSHVKTMSAPACGDAHLDPGETCDSGPFKPGARCGQACGTVKCGDPDDSGAISISDAQFVLAASLGSLAVCDPTVCDVDGSGSIKVADALSVLKRAVGLPANFACPVLVHTS